MKGDTRSTHKECGKRNRKGGKIKKKKGVLMDSLLSPTGTFRNVQNMPRNCTIKGEGS